MGYYLLGEVLILVLVLIFIPTPLECQEEYSYIVHASKRDKPLVYLTHHEWYISSVASIKGVSTQDLLEERRGGGLLYTYENVFDGFAVSLTKEQAEAIASLPGFVSSFQDRVLQPDTTRTPEFLSLMTSGSLEYDSGGIWGASRYGDGAIIGVLDTGIWPERLSFNDHVLGPVPQRWKGTCEEGTTFNASLCNRKLIGARAFYKGYESAQGPIDETMEYKSPRDNDGHGTHTASTAAGSFGYRAGLFGYANGTARGMAPRARLAAYKVCWKAGCFTSDILSALDTAVADGVDVISMSVGGQPVPFHQDLIAIATFAAMEKGVITSASAGNSGPKLSTVGNVAPWILTVAASSLDRDFPAPITLGDGTILKGVSLYSGKPLNHSQLLPLIYAGDAYPGGINNTFSRLCFLGSLDPTLVSGKVVLCDRGGNDRAAKAIAVKAAGGAAMILANSLVNGQELTADSYQIPASLVGFNAGQTIKSYIALTKSPTATITFQGTVLGVKPAPIMAAFSSRGPSSLTPDILKPDITAPGVNILAAWTGATGPSGQTGDRRKVKYDIMSGTSMSCPHVSGLAALITAMHPQWSPAAIKSALMTTASTVDNTGGPLLDGATYNSSSPFAYGAGHVSPNSAMNPGLVYDIGPQDYFDYLCGLGYKSEELTLFGQGKYNCSKKAASLALNYPSFSIIYVQNATSKYSTTLTRSVVNVGEASSLYKVVVSPPPGVVVSVSPTLLNFTSINQKLSYHIQFVAKPTPSNGTAQAFGYLEWTNKRHVVRSPIAFLWL